MDINSIIELKPNHEIPQLSPGDTVRVSTRMGEEGRERTQSFQGEVIRVRGRGASASFTVRRIAYGVGVERTFFLHSPSLVGVEVLRRGRVRRAKLYYLRGLSGKAARIKERTKAKKTGRSEARTEGG